MELYVPISSRQIAIIGSYSIHLPIEDVCCGCQESPGTPFQQTFCKEEARKFVGNDTTSLIVKYSSLKARFK